MPDAPTPLDLDAIHARADARRDYADERPESLHVHEDYAALADESAADVPALTNEVKRLRAEVARLDHPHGGFPERSWLAEQFDAARPAPAWDEDAVYDEAQTAAARVVAPYTSGPMDPLDVQVTDAVLTVVRRHLPVTGESRAQVQAEALRDAAHALAIVGRNPVGEPALVVIEEDLRARADRIEKGESR